LGKGQIINHLGDGQYAVKLLLDRARVTTRISEIEAMITSLTAKIAAMDDGPEKTRATLVKTSYEKQKQFLEENTPEDPTVNAWCADLTEDLTGEVGTVEVPGERGTVNIQPGYEGNAAYSEARDGQLQPVIAANPWAAFWNRAALPGWQKWKPTFRYGTITSLTGDLCNVTLDDAVSSASGLGINQDGSLTGVPISYMGCNGSAFEVGDSVIVEFTNQDWGNPVVVGFADHPKACGWEEPWGVALCDNHIWGLDIDLAGEVLCDNLPVSDSWVREWGWPNPEDDGETYGLANLAIIDGVLTGEVELRNQDTTQFGHYSYTVTWRRDENTAYPALDGILKAGVTGAIIGSSEVSIRIKWKYATPVRTISLDQTGVVQQDLGDIRPEGGGQIEYMQIVIACNVGSSYGYTNYSKATLALNYLQVIG
jgi:hypothetical protein